MSSADQQNWDTLAETSRPRYERLLELLRQYERVIVAYSGGCDSAFLLKSAYDALGSNVLAITAVGASLAPGERANAKALAAQIGAPHIEIESHEIENPSYVANPTNRCYHCKTELYDIALAEAGRRGIPHVLSGTNADELSDYRPGLKAAAEHGVKHPMAEAGLTKNEIRAWSKRLGLPTWDKPQTPCLSSRLPYGTPVTRERLAMVDRAEQAVRAAGLRIFRVRHHEAANGDAIARIEVSADEMLALLDPQRRTQVQQAVIAAGYKFVALDLEPFRSGRLNEAAGLVRLGAKSAA